MQMLAPDEMVDRTSELEKSVKSEGTEYSFILRNASEELERTYANYLYPYRSKFSAQSV